MYCPLGCWGRALVLFNSEAWFPLSRYVNPHNDRYWFIQNVMLMYKMLFCDVTDGVWCARSAARINFF